MVKAKVAKGAEKRVVRHPTAAERKYAGVLMRLRPEQHALLRQRALARALQIRERAGLGSGVREDASLLVRWLLDDWEKKGAPLPPLDWEG